MTRYVMLANWAPYVGTDYVNALASNNLADAEAEAEEHAWNIWEAPEEDGFEDEGPDVAVEEYNPEVHDGQRTGGGSFEEDFIWLEVN